MDFFVVYYGVCVVFSDVLCCLLFVLYLVLFCIVFSGVVCIVKSLFFLVGFYVVEWSLFWVRVVHTVRGTTILRMCVWKR